MQKFVFLVSFRFITFLSNQQHKTQTYSVCYHRAVISNLKVQTLPVGHKVINGIMST